MIMEELKIMHQRVYQIVDQIINLNVPNELNANISIIETSLANIWNRTIFEESISRIFRPRQAGDSTLILLLLVRNGAVVTETSLTTDGSRGILRDG